MDKSPKVAIIVPGWNGWEDTIGCRAHGGAIWTVMLGGIR